MLLRFTNTTILVLIIFLHGYPLRAVVPSRRGWSWVKWLASVEALALRGRLQQTGIDLFETS